MYCECKSVRESLEASTGSISCPLAIRMFRFIIIHEFTFLLSAQRRLRRQCSLTTGPASWQQLASALIAAVLYNIREQEQETIRDRAAMQFPVPAYLRDPMKNE